MTTRTKFSHRVSLSARKRGSFWREKRDIVIILARGFAKLLSLQNKSRTRQRLAFFEQQKAQLPAMRRTEQHILLTESKINRQGYKFATYFR